MVRINENELLLVQGDITKLDVDVIVNAANGTLMGGGGVDGAIHRAAGPELLEECKKIRKEELNGELLATGEVVITKGYNLPAKHVIHTVGPIWDDEGDKKEKSKLLENCYHNSLKLAHSKGLESIAFPSIATGVYRFPIELASKIAMKTIIDFLKITNFGKVYMTLFSDRDYQMYEKALKEII